MKKSSQLLQIEPVTQKIDFHRLNDRSELSHRSNASKMSAKSIRSVRSRRASNAKVDKKVEKPKKINAWETFEVNQFKVRNQQPSQIIDKLKELTSNDIPFMSELPSPDELDSTDPLDSLMTAFVEIVNAKNTDFTEEVKQGIHLATGTRTEFCEAMLKFICHH